MHKIQCQSNVIHASICDKHEFFQPVGFCRFLKSYKRSQHATNDIHSDINCYYFNIFLLDQFIYYLNKKFHGIYDIIIIALLSRPACGRIISFHTRFFSRPKRSTVLYVVYKILYKINLKVQVIFIIFFNTIYHLTYIIQVMILIFINQKKKKIIVLL